MTTLRARDASMALDPREAEGVKPTTSAHAAFERHVLPEIDLLLRVARSLTGDLAEAEDLVQDTLLRAYRSIEVFDGRHPRAWLLTILRNTHVNRNRRRRPVLGRDGDASSLPAPTVAGADVGVDGGLDAAIERALGELDVRFRRVVELVDVEGLTYAEAAAALDIAVGTVMSRLHRARRRLREHLERTGVDTGSEP